MQQATATSTQPVCRELKRSDYEHFLPMVRRIAMRLARRVPSHISVGDLIGAGWVGLMETCARSQPTMPDEEFAAYASHRVRGAMLDYLRQLDPATRRARNTSRRVAKATSELTQGLQRPPREEEIAEALGLTLDDYHALLTTIASAGMTRLDMASFDRLDIVPSWSEPPDEAAEKRLLIEAVTDAITDLPERLQQIVALYYQEECTMREIGAVLGVSESRVCQLHAEAMHRLRAAIGRS